MSSLLTPLHLIRRILSAIFPTPTPPTPPPSRREAWIANAGKFAAAKMVTEDTSLALVWADSPESLAELLPWMLLVGAS